MSEEKYISVDIESAGPIPGSYSMLSLGACVVGELEKSFYTEFQPINKAFVPDALKVSGFNLAGLEKTGVSPAIAMSKFANWILEVSQGAKPVFVGFNGCYDWQFVNWYFVNYCEVNPFGFGGIDIKSYYMGLTGLKWSATTSSQLPPRFKPDVPQTHNALDDAKAQASIFSKLLSQQRSLR
jgi:DNA polymerase III epsilon subunit-like protein